MIIILIINAWFLCFVLSYNLFKWYDIKRGNTINIEDKQVCVVMSLFGPLSLIFSIAFTLADDY